MSQHDIAGLEITMYYPFAVQMEHCRCDIVSQLQGSRVRQVSALLAQQAPVQRLPQRALHNSCTQGSRRSAAVSPDIAEVHKQQFYDKSASDRTKTADSNALLICAAQSNWLPDCPALSK